MNHVRRTILGVVVATPLVALGASTQPEVTTEDEPYADPVLAESWFSESRMRGAATNPLKLGRFVDRWWYTLDTIGWRPDAGQTGHRPVTVPKGFVTDMASIPRVFWTILPPDGTYGYAAVLHDYLYWEQKTSRGEADEIFGLCMQDFKVPSATIAIILGAVRTLGGRRAWLNNARLKSAGERRIMREFPTDPTMRWETWKDRRETLI